MKLGRRVYVLVIMCPLAASGRGPSPQAPAEMASSSGLHLCSEPGPPGRHRRKTSLRSPWSDRGYTQVLLQHVEADKFISIFQSPFSGELNV